MGVKLVKDTDEVMLITDRGQTLRTRVDEIRETGRNAQGVRIMTTAEGERIVALERLAETRGPRRDRRREPAARRRGRTPPSESQLVPAPRPPR